MADDPSRAPDDGAIQLPKIDGAMNKRPPIRRKGGKGSEHDGKISRLGTSRSKDEEVLDKMLKQFERAVRAEGDDRKEALEDAKFYVGDQWPASIRADREQQRKPCHTVNKLPTLVLQVTNDIRQNRPGITINPTGDRTDPEVAKIYSGMIKAIQRDSHAELAYDTGTEWAVKIGWGYWRITTDYENPETFDQVIRIDHIRNPFAVYMDPDAKDPCGHDAEFAFIANNLTKDEFKERYPKAQTVPFEKTGIGDKLSGWATQDHVRVVEYFKVSTEIRKLVSLDNGHTGWEDELADDIKEQVADGSIEVVRERESQQRKITIYTASGIEILDTKEWAGTEGIPIVRVVGEETDVDGKVKRSGIIRHAKDSQRMYNYWRTKETEVIALAPNAKWLMEEGQIEGYEQMWKTANTDAYPYLLYKGTSLGGKPAPPPNRLQPDGAPQGIEVALQGAAQDLMATTGVRFDASMHERMIDESGKAIRELRRSGDIGHFHFADNTGSALRRTGHILIDLIPKIYDRKRMITILREDDAEERIMIDPHLQRPMQEVRPPTGKPFKVFNPKMGTYGVTVTIGPSYATKRIESAERMMEFAKAMPQVAQVVADLIAKNQDWEGADEMARRLAKMVPAQLMTPEQKDMSPQVQAFVQQQQQQIQQMQQLLQQMNTALNEKKTEHALTQDKIDKDFEAKLLAIIQKAEAAEMKAEGDKIKNLAEQAKELHAQLFPHQAQVMSMQQHIDELKSHITKPKKIKIQRDEKGFIKSAEVEAEQPPKPEQKPSAQAMEPPQELLRDGKVTKFKNGQAWTRKNGKASRVNV